MNKMLIVGLLALLVTGCGRSEAERLVITGSSTVAPLVNEIARRYEQQHPGIRVDVQTGGSSRGINDARSGLAHIGMASRALKPGEDDLQAHAIAVDGIALIVHRDNSVMSLNTAQVRAIFTGQTRDWSEVGGGAGPITVINKAEGRATLELFLSYFSLKNPEIRADVVIGDNEQGLKTLVSDRQAISYVSIGAAEAAEQRGDPVRRLSKDGVEASTAALREGRYPLTRPLNLVTQAAPSDTVQAFIAYARSPEVHDLVTQFSFVPLP